MQKHELRELLRRYAAGTCTEHEQKLLEDLILRKPLLGVWEWSNEEEKVLMSIRIKQAIDQQRLKMKKRPTKVKKLWRLAIAASIVAILGFTGLWLYDLTYKPENKQLAINESVPYSSEGVTLILADGSQVNLDELESGIVQQRGDLAIKKTADGQLIYEYANQLLQINANSVAQNTIRVPNGTNFQLKLPDGTRVWLNTASSLTFPIAFTNDERRVVLDGEAYFEVAHDATNPFKVIANGTEVLVTGTHFNVSAYRSDQRVITTLLEGGVNIIKDNQEVFLTPGYQAVTYFSSNTIDKQKGDLEQAVAWKSGYFVFNNMDLISIMKSVARWYDIHVIVQGEIPVKKFGGTFPVSADLDELLDDLSTLTKVKFHKEGKEVKIIW